MNRIVLGIGMAAVLAGPAVAQISNTPEIAAEIRGMGTELTREVVGGTMALYEPLHTDHQHDGVKVTEQPYGSHERNVLDVFAPAHAAGLPVLVYVHGGGFVRGDKDEVANIGYYAAEHGLIGVTINYRLAPEVTWPAGAEDLRDALDWIGENIGEYGGDPDRIVIAGNSAGAMHVADYTFHEEYQLEDDGVVGAVLLSTPTVSIEGRELDPQRDAVYYDADGDLAAQSVINALDGRKLPLLIGFAEYEPESISNQVAQLIAALTERDGRLPLVTSAPGHNHISIVEHFGTADETLGPDILEFISLVTVRP